MAVNKYSIANKKRWAKMSKLEKSTRMRKLALLRHAKMSKQSKKELGKQLALSRTASRVDNFDGLKTHLNA